MKIDFSTKTKFLASVAALGLGLFAAGFYYTSSWQSDQRPIRTIEQEIKSLSRGPDPVPKPSSQSIAISEALERSPPDSTEHRFLQIKSLMLSQPVTGIRSAASELRVIAKKGEKLEPQERTLAMNLISELHNQAQIKDSLLARLVLTEIAGSNPALNKIVHSLRGSVK